MNYITNYINIAIAIVVIAYVAHREYTINSLETDIKNLEQAHLVAGVNYTECDETIKEQNEAIALFALEADKARKEFEEYKQLPPEVKVETKIIYKDVNNTREDRTCEEYEAIERNTYFLDWNK